MIRLRLSKGHFLTWSPQGLKDSGKCGLLDPDAWDFLSCLEDDVASHALTATVDGQLVGWLRCTHSRGVLYAQGTWVGKSHRGQGIARTLWDKAMVRFHPEVLHVDTVSDGGRGIVQGLRRRYPGTRFIQTGPV